MIRVSIKKDLERRLRKAHEKYYEDAEISNLIGEVISLLDEESKKRETGSSKAKGGLGYKELVSLFRFHLGSDLVVPPKPNPTYIVRMVNQAAQMGVSSENVEQAIWGLRRDYPRGPYQLPLILFKYDLHYSRGTERGGGAERGIQESVYTGRESLDDLQESD